ncbi:PREDICTED: glutathione S-transferase T3-like [Erythranthe guttata]|uniref:glutathione S-transferase T3-like n=1 Tax=Erythranthe guttata TaxID=4155 RepID=UPI00064DC92F|nr:PREDICTED: glutathione S-transferase T3-like [Erythranthe guttata]|eukprot:XP_012834532.1 PREDICTED: glutathione S-transferase T3-like [Erythranthe guttata]
MDSGYNGSFTDLLNDDSLVYEESCAVDSNIDIEDTNKVQVQPRSKRSSNFSREEDICIVSSWLNISKDAIHGSDQKSSRFWARIYDRFITNSGQRGRSEQSLEEARKLYAANTNGRGFKFEHCLNLLKYERKWLDTFEKNKQTRTTFATVDGVPTSSEAQGESSANKDRPLGTKSSKERAKKNPKKSEGESSTAMTLTDERWEAKLALERERIAQRERLIAIQEKAIHVDEERKEIEIMKKDTIGMDATQAAYWNMMKMEVLKKHGFI